MSDSVIIIGAGIAGLSAGCYLQMNGYKTQIFEAHSIPGGLCTGWNRHVRGKADRYSFDGCMQFLVGSGPGTPFYDMWCELVDMSAVEFFNPDRRLDLEIDRPDRHGDRVFHLYTDPDHLERYLKDIAPEDAATIDEFLGSIRALEKYPLPPLWDVAPEVRTWRDRLRLVRYLPFLLYVQKWGKVTNFRFADRLRNPFLRAAFRQLFEGQELGIMVMTVILAWWAQKSCGLPIGGSRGFAERIAARYESLGGTIHYHAPVRHILVENDRATGIELVNGQTYHASTIVSAADGHWTIFEALDGRYADRSIRDLYEGKTLKTFEAVVRVSLGVARTFESEPWLLRFPLAEPLTIADGTCFESMEAHICNYDPTMAPRGRTALSVTLYTRDHAFWTDLRERDPDAYEAAKDTVARQVIDRLEARLGDVKDKVEVIDVATPATFIRYTHNWQGSYEGWYVSDNPLAPPVISKTLPGLDRFYMTGQWVEPGGGLPIVAQSGRNLAQIICKRDGKRFAAAPCRALRMNISATPARSTLQAPIHEPGRLEVFITLLAGRLGGTAYREYVAHLNLKGSERVLDFGSGSGNPARYLAPRLLSGGGHLTCLDISRKWIEVCRRRLAGYPNIGFILGDIRTLGLPAAAYDVVFVHFVLHDIPAGQRPSTVAALVRVLAAGGRLCLREPLRFIDQAEIRGMMHSAGLQETASRTVEVPTQGEAFEAVYVK